MAKLSKPSRYLKKNEVAIEQYMDVGFYKDYWYLVKYYGDEYHLQQAQFPSKQSALKFARHIKKKYKQIKKITWSPSHK